MRNLNQCIEHKIRTYQNFSTENSWVCFRNKGFKSLNSLGKLIVMRKDAEDRIKQTYLDFPQ